MIHILPTEQICFPVISSYCNSDARFENVENVTLCSLKPAGEQGSKKRRSHTGEYITGNFLERSGKGFQNLSMMMRLHFFPDLFFLLTKYILFDKLLDKKLARRGRTSHE
jgi:hypothetical protein